MKKLRIKESKFKGKLNQRRLGERVNEANKPWVLSVFGARTKTPIGEDGQELSPVTIEGFVDCVVPESVTKAEVIAFVDIENLDKDDEEEFAEKREQTFNQKVRNSKAFKALLKRVEALENK